MKFKKKPAVIDAVKWTGVNLLQIIKFTGQRSLHCADHCAGARDAIRKQEEGQ